MTKVIVKCSKCEEDCVLGIDAILVKGEPVCDDCGNVERATNGFVIDLFDDQCTCRDASGNSPDCPLHGRV